MEKKEFLFKVLVVGDVGTGKTSIVKRYSHQFFSPHYQATLGVDFALKILNWSDDKVVKLQFWDIAGQERNKGMTRVYYKEAVGAFVVFDVTRGSTKEAVKEWKNDLDSKVFLRNGSNVPAVLLANKCDLEGMNLFSNKSEMEPFSAENNFVAWYETSAKENIGIDEAVSFLVQEMLENHHKDDTLSESNSEDKSTNPGMPPETPKNGCCCNTRRQNTPTHK